jgi:hypothetical protein
MKFVPELSLYQKKEEKKRGEFLVQEVQRQRAHSASESMVSRLQNGHCHGLGYPTIRIRLANLVTAEAGGVGQLAGLETSGLRGTAGERIGAVAVAIGRASSGSGHTGGGRVVILILVVVLVLAVVILLIVILLVVVLVIVSVVLVGTAVLKVTAITSGGRSRSRRGRLQLRCVSTERRAET